MSGPTPDDFRAKVFRDANTLATGASRKCTMTAVRKLQSSAAEMRGCAPFDTATVNIAHSMRSSYGRINLVRGRHGQVIGPDIISACEAKNLVL